MPQLKVRIGCVVLAVIMSAVTYYFVEPRLRWGRFGGYKAAGLLCAMILVGVAGYSIHRHDGYTARMDDPEQKMIDVLTKGFREAKQRCLSRFPDWNSKIAGGEFVCRLQRGLGKNNIAVIGDSHAIQLYPGLVANVRKDEGIAVFPAGCAIPLIGLHSNADSAALKRIPLHVHTEHLLSEAFNYILRQKNIKKVVLSHHPSCSWNNVVDTFNPENHDFNSILHDGFVRTYDALTKAGKEIYVILDNPSFSKENYLQCKSSAIRRPWSVPFVSYKKAHACTVKQFEVKEKRPWNNWNKTSRELAANYKNIHFIDLEKVFCRNGTCSMLDNKGHLLYRDQNHLNIKGSMIAAPYIFKELRE